MLTVYIDGSEATDSLNSCLLTSNLTCLSVLSSCFCWYLDVSALPNMLMPNHFRVTSTTTFYLQSIRLCALVRDLRHGKSTAFLCCALTMFSTVFLIYLAFATTYTRWIVYVSAALDDLVPTPLTLLLLSLLSYFFDCLSRILTKLSMLLATYWVSYNVSVSLVVSMWAVLKITILHSSAGCGFYALASYSCFPCAVCLSIASALICSNSRYGSL